LEDNLIVFIIEPEQIGFACFAVFGHPYSHCVVSCLFKLCSFSSYNLL